MGNCKDLYLDVQFCGMITFLRDEGNLLHNRKMLTALCGKMKGLVIWEEGRLCVSVCLSIVSVFVQDSSVGVVMTWCFPASLRKKDFSYPEGNPERITRP